MNYLSVCSGIEAASVAWHPLGWTAAAYAEIETFPSAVLRHHYPTVPNWGDMTRFKEWPDATLDVLVGGTPCQSFSVAGLRAGLADPRGNLALVYLALLDRYRPRWCVWENVPGVLSSDGGRDFGALLGGLGQLGYGWSYRVLDAQYFGVAQRRRRVFVVGCLGNWSRAAAVLFERASLLGDPPPRRRSGQGFTGDVRDGIAGSLGSSETGGWGSRLDTSGAFIPEISNSISARDYKGACPERDQGAPLLITHSLTGNGFDAGEDGTGRGTPLVPIAFSAQDSGNDASYDISPTMRAEQATYRGGNVAVAFNWQQGGATALGMGREGVPPVRAEQTLAMYSGMAVRRLTPRECERLQGFPDDYTLIPYRGKPAADGPRYKALGNSMAVPVMAWIGRRLQAVDEIP